MLDPFFFFTGPCAGMTSERNLIILDVQPDIFNKNKHKWRKTSGLSYNFHSQIYLMMVMHDVHFEIKIWLRYFTGVIELRLKFRNHWIILKGKITNSVKHYFALGNRRNSCFRITYYSIVMKFWWNSERVLISFNLEFYVNKIVHFKVTNFSQIFTLSSAIHAITR